jgi:tetratricopeptide (TPR) repeat protein
MRKSLGPDHPHTLGAMVNLASILEYRGEVPAAEKLLRDALEAWRTAHGENNPGTLLAGSSLAMLCHATRRLPESEELIRRVLEGRTRILGPDHPDTIGSQSNLGLILSDMGKDEEAEAAYLAAWDRYGAVVGEAHPDTLTTALNLVSLYEGLGWPERSAAHMPRLLSTLRRVTEIPTATASNLNACAWLLLTVEPASLQDPAAALPFAERACSTERAAGGAELWQYLDTLALAQHRTGAPTAAARSQREAISLVPAAGEGYRAEMQERLAQYEAASAGGK